MFKISSYIHKRKVFLEKFPNVSFYEVRLSCGYIGTPKFIYTCGNCTYVFGEFEFNFFCPVCSCLLKSIKK